MGVVVDASVCAKWLFAEEHQAQALRLLVLGRRFHGPDLLVAEIGSITWKKCIRGSITPHQAELVLATFRNAPIDLTPTFELARGTLAIGLDLRQSFYDCLYLALAQREQAQLVTADQRLRRKVAGTAYAAIILWIEDVP